LLVTFVGTGNLNKVYRFVQV